MMSEMPHMNRLSLGLFLLAAGLLIGVGSFFVAKRPRQPEGMLQTDVAVRNDTSEQTRVYVAFGADSDVLPADWAFCQATSALECNFPLDKNADKELPVKGRYLNATFSFGAVVACGITKAEVNINNPGWADTTDVSLVDGFSNKVSVESYNPDVGMPVILGPPKGKDGNEKVFGLFPLGCDICVARNNPPCGIAKGRTGCKHGTQYNPDVPCQYQRSKKGGKLVVVFHGQ